MTKRITAMLLTLVTLFSLVAVPANAASTLEEAMAEVNVYARNDDLDWLRVNGAVKTQHFTFYLYRSELTGQTKEIPAYCTDPRLYGVPALVPEGTSIKYGADGTVTDPKIMGICADGWTGLQGIWYNKCNSFVVFLCVRRASSAEGLPREITARTGGGKGYR